MEPLFEVVVPTTTAASRRLTTAANVRSIIGSPTGDDTKIETIIDRVSAAAAKYCQLARDAAGAEPTFGSETVRATWYRTNEERSQHLLLPWRAPITSITSMVENGVTLTAGTHYKLFGGARMLRLSDDAPRCWPCSKIVATYVGGWTLPADVPPDLEDKVIEQVKATYLGGDRDPNIKSETVDQVYSATYDVPVGDGVGGSGFLESFQTALGPYKDWSI